MTYIYLHLIQYHVYIHLLTFSIIPCRIIAMNEDTEQEEEVEYSHLKKFKLTRGCCSPLTTLPVLPPQWQVSFNLLPNNPMAPPQCEGSFGPSAAPGHQWFPHNDSLWTEPSQLFRFHALCSWSIPMVSSKVTYM